jgi:hypothetical protein
VEAFVACLVEAGLPAEVSDSGDGQGFVAWGEGVEVWVGDPEGRIWAASMVGKSVAAERPVGGFDQVAAMTVANPGRWVALVDGTDRSEEYGTCREAYPYTEPTAAPVDPAQELAAKERMVEASNRWAACVRENGFPGVADVPRAVADNWDTTPMVLLPTWIEEAALRALMKVWPEFDRAVEGAYHEAMMSGRTDVEYPGAPSIGFDVPGYDGTEAESDLPAEEVERLEGLMAIVRAERGEFFSSLGGVGSGSQTWALRHPRHRALLELSSDFALSLVRAPLG